MVLTGAVLEFLEAELARKEFLCVSVFGSCPDDLEASADLDVAVVLDHRFYERGMDWLSEVAQAVCDQFPILTYTFAHGPIKFEHKALLHFLVYTDQEVGTQKPSSYKSEKYTVRYNQQRTERNLVGSSLASFAPATELPADSSNMWMRDSLERFRSKGLVPGTWFKKDGSWRFARRSLELSSWQREHVEKWFEKHE